MNIDGLSLDQMRAALAVAECGTFSAAARRFNRAQSALSYAVTTLEKQLGVQLFDRTDGLAPRPTQTGRVLLREMEVVVRHADEIKEQARDIRANEKLILAAIERRDADEAERLMSEHLSRMADVYRAIWQPGRGPAQ